MRCDCYNRTGINPRAKSRSLLRRLKHYSPDRATKFALFVHLRNSCFKNSAFRLTTNRLILQKVRILRDLKIEARAFAAYPAVIAGGAALAIRLQKKNKEKAKSDHFYGQKQSGRYSSSPYPAEIR